MKISNNQEQYKKAFKKTTTSAAEVCYTRKKHVCDTVRLWQGTYSRRISMIINDDDTSPEEKKRRKCIVHTFSVGDVDDGGIRE